MLNFNEINDKVKKQGAGNSKFLKNLFTYGWIGLTKLSEEIYFSKSSYVKKLIEPTKAHFGEMIPDFFFLLSYSFKSFFFSCFTYKKKTQLKLSFFLYVKQEKKKI